MNKKAIDINHEVNEFLKTSYLLEIEAEKYSPSLASQIRRTSSQFALFILEAHKIQNKLVMFLKEQEGLSQSYE